MQENIETVELIVDTEVAAETKYQIIVIVSLIIIVANTDIGAGAVVEIERLTAADPFEPKPVHVDEKKVSVVVVEIPRKKNV